MGLCGHYSSLCQHTIHEDVYRCFDIIDTSQWVPNGYYVGQVFKTAQDFIFVLLTRELLAIQFNQQIHFLCRGKDVTLTFFFFKKKFFWPIVYARVDYVSSWEACVFLVETPNQQNHQEYSC